MDINTMKLRTGALALYIFVTIFAFTTSASIRTDSPIVNIPFQGSVLGAIDKTSWTQQEFFAFRGIPFAESPSGPLRFQPPKSKAPWNETLDVRNFGRACPSYENVLQLNDTQRKEDLEECLTLTIYSKELKAKRPVIFYVYGGAFRTGSASQVSPGFLLEKNIVLVVTQYRTGPFGFMTTFTNEIPGNVAIMDVQLALNWVQKNIHVFGGDATQVTILGQSAGAAMVGATMISPKTSPNYFQRSIIQSGSIMGAWAINRIALDQVKRVCELLDCAECNDVQGQNKCMKNADVVDLLKAAQPTDQGIMFSPVVGDIHGVLPDEPKVLLEKLNHTVPLMTGFNKEDGVFIMRQHYDTVLQQYGSFSKVTVRQFANHLLDASKDTTRLANNWLLRKSFKKELLDTNNHTDALLAYFDISNAVNFKSPIIAYANAMQRKSATVYVYAFDYFGEPSSNNGYDSSQYPFVDGVHHTATLTYLFGMFPFNSNDTKMAKKMVDLWHSFSVDGEPKIANQPDLVIKPMETESGPYFHINSEITFGYNVLKELTATSDDPESYKLIKPNSSDIIAQWWN